MGPHEHLRGRAAVRVPAVSRASPERVDSARPAEHGRPLVATPVSRLFCDPVAAVRLVELSDALELRDLARVALPDSELPLLFHCEASVIAPLDERFVRESIEPLCVSGRLRLVSFHAACCYPRAEVVDGMFVPSGKTMARDEMLTNAAHNLGCLRRWLPPWIEIAIENNNWFPGPAYETVTDPEFLSELCASSGAWLLLDLAHARITSGNRGIDADRYLRALPLERVIQLHLSGYRRSGTLWRDTHAELDDEQWQDARRVVGLLPRLRWVTVEYYADPRVLEQMIIAARSITGGDHEVVLR